MPALLEAFDFAPSRLWPKLPESLSSDKCWGSPNDDDDPLSAVFPKLDTALFLARKQPSRLLLAILGVNPSVFLLIFWSVSSCWLLSHARSATSWPAFFFFFSSLLPSVIIFPSLRVLPHHRLGATALNTDSLLRPIAPVSASDSRCSLDESLPGRSGHLSIIFPLWRADSWYISSTLRNHRASPTPFCHHTVRLDTLTKSNLRRMCVRKCT